MPSDYTDSFRNFTIRMIPYATFVNRSETDIPVWLHVK